LLTLALCISGCGLSIPNGVFSCVGASDCPSGYFCWNSDGRCYDAAEPRTLCQPASCEGVIAQFASVDVSIECGTLPDGCDGVVDCPPCSAGETCGANGRSFLCGCEQSSCSTYGAECGTVPVGCGSAEQVDCGQCPGSLTCENNRCVCPGGEDCNLDCGGCGPGEICVEGECCMPSFPCAENECSPPGGLRDGCGGFVDCPACGSDESCELQASTQGFECLGNCTCEAEGVECGTVSICGASQYCGICERADAPLCESGRCVREDRYEENEDPEQASSLSCGGPCGLKNLSLELDATLDSAGDFDFYRIDLAHDEEYAVRVDVTGLQSTRQILLTYVCPDGSERIADCSGSSSPFASTTYCIEDAENTSRLVQECGDSGGTATLIVGVSAKEGEFSGPVDTYSLTVSSYPYDD
jgi:hypothetical protein